MIFHKIVIVLLTIQLVCAIHLETQADAQNKYLNALNQQQTNFENKFGEFKQSLKNVDEQLLNANKLDEKIKILENGIGGQESSLFNMQKQLLPQLDLQKCNCQNISAEQKDSLIAKSKETIQKLKKMEKQIQSIENKQNQVQLEQMKRNIRNQIFYVQRLSTVLNSNCTIEAFLTPTVFQSNVYANNWILGDQTINDLIKTYIQRSKVQQNITNCPIEKPFFDGKQCIVCGENQVFNMQTEKCMKCGDKKIFSVKQRNCVDDIILINNIFTNKQWITEDGKLADVFKDYQNIVEKNKTLGKYQMCAKQTPFLIDEKCSKCQYWQVYNLQLKKCIQPNQQYKYDANLHNLVKPIQNFQTLSTASNILATSVPEDNPKITNCQAQKPYFDGITCVNCIKPFELFDLHTKRCVSCKSQEYYDNKTRQCKKRLIIYENGKTDNLVGTVANPVKSYQESTNKLKSQNPQAIIVHCKPDENAKLNQCVKCSPGQYFNTATLSCFNCTKVKDQICYDGTVFVPNIDKIQDKIIVDNFEEYKKKIQDQSKNTDNIIKCTEQKPFATQKQCIACPQQTPLFNINSEKCEKCEDKLVYNKQSKKCQEKKKIFMSNPLKAKNFIGKSTQDVDQYFTKQSQLAKQSQNTEVCPQDKPYTNGIECFSCEGNTPIYNVTSKQCTTCSEGQHLNVDKYACQKCQLGTSWDKQKKICSPIPIHYIPNSLAKKYLGGKEEVEKYLKEQQTINKQNPNTVVCPLQKPFTVGTQCSNCQQPNPLFDIKTKICSNCPDGSYFNQEIYSCSQCKDGYKYDLTTKKCEHLPNITNFNHINRVIIAVNTKLQDYDPKNTDLPCPDKTPFFSGQQCIDCNEKNGGNLFDATLRKCTQCPQNSSYILQTHRCSQGSFNVTNPAFFNKLISPQSVPKIGVKDHPCNQVKPFYNGNQCQSCPSQKPYFKISTKQCIQCSQNTVYNEALRDCKAPVYSSNFQSGLNKILLPQGKTIEDLKQQQKSNGAIVCASQKPFYDGKQCINCAQGEIFNIQQKKCQKCKQFTKYNSQTHKCQERNYVSNLQDFNWSSEDMNALTENVKKQLQQKTAQECPKQLPFSVGKSCINCESGTPFNMDTKKCQKCPQGLVLDIKTHKCATPFKFITNPNATNLIFDGYPLDQLLQKYKAEKAVNQDLKDCPSEAPYYNGVQCMICSNKQPYFNIATKKCQVCAQGTHYDQKMHECLKNTSNTTNTNTQQTSITKLAAGVFSHNNQIIENRNLHRMYSNLYI